MIVTLTPNPAVDLTYRVGELTLGESIRVGSVASRAGGKGLNVAGTLQSMGVPALAIAPVGGSRRTELEADLDARGVCHHLVDSPVPTRQTVAVVEESTGAVTLLSEPGTAHPPHVWNALREACLAGLADRNDPGGRATADGPVLVVAGSIAAAADIGPLHDLLAAAGAQGTRLLLDLRDDALRGALALRPALVKPNAAEALATTGHADPIDAAQALVDQGARAAVVSSGAEGVVLVTSEGERLRAGLPEGLIGNPTGAGDAMAASLAHAMTRALDCRAALREAVAWAGAAVLHPQAGSVNPADVARLTPTVRLEEIRWR